MATASAKKIITVALIGNPNTGKSTVFSALAGIHQQVGNYPGVTVEKKIGHMDFAQQRFELIDLPGLYSLAPRSSDEMVAVNVLLGHQIDCQSVDAVICIVDASNLSRNMYLVSQVLELGKPTVLAVNMLDVAKSRGISLDLAMLQEKLGVQVIGMQAHRRIGLADLKIALTRAIAAKSCPCGTVFCEVFEREAALLQKKCDSMKSVGGSDVAMPSFLARRLLLDSNGYLEQKLSSASDVDLSDYLQLARQRLALEGCKVPGIEISSRYDWINNAINDVISEPSNYAATYSDRIDSVLTHRVAGLAIFAVMLLVIFQSVFVWAKPAMNAIQAVTNALGGLVTGILPEGALQSLLVDGVISGMGSVLAFLPQILILFIFIAILEDCGYMARAAFLMDRMMSRVGLSGRSCIPMLSSFACAVPGIMAARVIENERDRLTTILVSPLLTCSARLPVYVLLIAAFIPGQTYLGGLLNLQGLTFAALYVLGIVTAVIAAMIMKRTILRGQSPPFVLELPSYKWPSPRVVFYRVGQRCWVFLRFAGTLILAVSILVWAALYYPHNTKTVEPLMKHRQELQNHLAQLTPGNPQSTEISANIAQLDRDIEAEYQRNSILGHLGHIIEPAVKPLGWDWRIGCAVIASLPAREVVVATLGVMYNLGKDTDYDSQNGFNSLQKRLHSVTWDGTDRPVFNIPVALSLMVFFALCAQCIATLAVIRRETNSWRWPVFAFTYMTCLAYIGALITYQLGVWISS